jgi:hypothetical protein
MSGFDEVEHTAKRYLESRQNKESDSKNFAIKIIDYISSPDLKFPLRKGGLISNGTTSYVYTNSIAYPNLFEFISEILHSKIPITINDVRFGPGEIIVNRGTEREAEQELALAIKELQKLIHAKRAELFRK